MSPRVKCMVSKLICSEHMALLFLAIFNILLSWNILLNFSEMPFVLKNLFEYQISSRTISFLYLYTGHNPGNNLTPASWRNSTWTKCLTINLAVCSGWWFDIRWQSRAFLFASRKIKSVMKKTLPHGDRSTLMPFKLGPALRVLYIVIFFQESQVRLGFLLNLAIAGFILD